MPPTPFFLLPIPGVVGGLLLLPWGPYAAGLSSPEGREGHTFHAAPDVWLHSSTKRKRAFPVRCAKAAGRKLLYWLTPVPIK